MSGGKDGVVCLWDETFTHTLKTYQLHSSAIQEGGGVLHSDLPPIRALVMGQGKILVGTRNSEVCMSQLIAVLYIRVDKVSSGNFCLGGVDCEGRGTQTCCTLIE